MNASLRHHFITICGVLFPLNLRRMKEHAKHDLIGDKYRFQRVSQSKKEKVRYALREQDAWFCLQLSCLSAWTSLAVFVVALSLFICSGYGSFLMGLLAGSMIPTFFLSMCRGVDHMGRMRDVWDSQSIDWR